MPAPKHDNQHDLRASTAQKQTSDDGSVKGLSSPADQQTLYSTPYLTLYFKFYSVNSRAKYYLHGGDGLTTRWPYQFWGR